MKFILRLKCQNCPALSDHPINLSQNDHRYKCAKCDKLNVHSLFEISVGERLLYFRSAYEYEEKKDYSLSVVFSAMAFECELFALFKRWKLLENFRKRKQITDMEIRKFFQNEGSILRRMDRTLEQIGFKKFDECIKVFQWLPKKLNDFPSLRPTDLSKSIHENLFKPRNEVLHYGQEQTSECAKKAFNIAGFGLNILSELDKLHKSIINERLGAIGAPKPN